MDCLCHSTKELFQEHLTCFIHRHTGLHTSSQGFLLRFGNTGKDCSHSCHDYEHCDIVQLNDADSSKRECLTFFEVFDTVVRQGCHVEGRNVCVTILQWLWQPNEINLEVTPSSPDPTMLSEHGEDVG